MEKLWYVVGVLLLAAMALIGRRSFANKGQPEGAPTLADQMSAKVHVETSAVPREQYVLEVIGLGVTADKYRQAKLWEALQSGTPFTSIREQDPKKYPWDDNDKLGVSGGRVASTLENGAGYTVSEWGVPVFNAGPPRCEYPDDPMSPGIGMTGGAESSGMISYVFVAADRLFSERPDRLLENVFGFFDTHPDIPYVFVTADDGIGSRVDCERRDPSKIHVGYYVPKRTDASTMLILARRERAEPLRPFAYDDIDNYELGIERINRDGIARRLWLEWWKLQKTVPRLDPENTSRRVLTVAEWLDAAAKLSVRPDFRGDGSKHKPSKNWKPTPWFPIPWSKSQLQDFDNMHTVGYLHRPIYVKTVDQHNKPLTNPAARRAALLAGFDEALKTLPESERAKGLARVIAATHGQTQQLVALEGVLHDYAAQGGPKIDSGKLEQFINMDRRLGDTGAATWFTQMAIGVMGSYRAGGASMAINLRDPHEASIVMITPPENREREAFRNIQQPAIDPANYSVPAH
ncbi:MAG: type VI lipase adapter Tla3 domain-containing protein [Telluria sp.]